MLATAEWIIPDATKSILSDAECLTIVLSIYFHDMGLVVTETEFQHRADSGFRAFCNDHLFTGSGGADYQAKIGLLDPDHKERFLYQEYVRANHGRRIRAWIEGTQNPDLGYAKVQIEEIDRLLRPLDTDYRKDLALVCESQNLDDLDDLKKYRLSHPYGNSDNETVNLQYCATVL